MCVHKKGKKTHYQSQGSGHGTSNDDILDDEEESMDWWTKYFASVDAMIEVIRIRSLFLAADVRLIRMVVFFGSLEQFETAGLTFINNLATSNGDIIVLQKEIFCCFLTFDGICNVIKDPSWN